jgi:acetyl esterase/lipase
MAYTLDAEIAAVFTAMAEQGMAKKPTPRGDWKALRDSSNELMSAMMGAMTPTPDVEIKLFSTTAKDGAKIELRWTTKKNGKKGPAVLYIHGGGMILGTAAMYDPVVSEYVNATGVPFLSVEYRLAPEVQGTTLVEDSFAGLTWLVENAAKLGVDPKRIAVMGDSAGGGIAAGVAIVARDRNVKLAKQILIYPMLDDTNLSPDPELDQYAVWSFDNNFTGWRALLGDAFGTDRVPVPAAPSRLKDFTGLAPAYIDVGELDIFRDEDIAYAGKIAAARIPVELHVHPGAPHGFERMAPQSGVARRAMADRFRIIQSF